jgi:hypothetical protein
MQLQYAAMNGRTQKEKSKRKIKRRTKRNGAVVVREDALCKFGIRKKK